MVLKKVYLILPIILLIFSIVFNLYLLFPETSIKSEVNDNAFAFGLTLRMEKAWNEGLCPFSLNCLPNLMDHWVSYWAMGYPLPHFYQHIPDLAVVIIYKFITLFSNPSLYSVFQYFKYILLSLIPLSYFISAKKFGFSNLAASLSALVSTQISTQYLYGTDYNALVWRGSGMFTQLWGIFFLPLAVSSIYEYFKKKSQSPLQSVIFIALAISSHVVFGFIALLSSVFIPIVFTISKSLKTPKEYLFDLFNNFKRLFLVFVSSFLILSYWLIPLIQNSTLRNKSIWDDLTKFDSFGMQQIIKWFFNGQIFDANRLPVLTVFVIIGLFLTAYLYTKAREERKETNPSLLIFPLLFVFWFVLYFGRKTWGPIIDIIPMMDDMHIHRLINGVHFAGIFILGFTLSYLIENTKTRTIELKNSIVLKIPPLDLRLPVLVILLFTLIPVFKERSEFLNYNKYLIYEYNRYYDEDSKDFQKIISYLGPRTNSRIYAGRPGNWGHEFKIGGTSIYLELSQRGYDTVTFLPETWSLNSDIEQYFNDQREDHYRVFNVGYVLAPTNQKFPDFIKPVIKAGKYNLFKYEAAKNLAFIESPLAIKADKKSFLSFNIDWLKSDWPKSNLYPTVVYKGKTTNINDSQKTIGMIDSSTYQEGDNFYPLFNPNPFQKSAPKIDLLTKQFSITDEKVSPNGFSAKISSPTTSPAYLLSLKATYHPYWQAFVDGNKIDTYMISPSFLAINVPSGQHTIDFVYKPSALKITLIYVSLISLIIITSLSTLKLLKKPRMI